MYTRVCVSTTEMPAKLVCVLCVKEVQLLEDASQMRQKDCFFFSSLHVTEPCYFPLTVTISAEQGSLKMENWL